MGCIKVCGSYMSVANVTVELVLELSITRRSLSSFYLNVTLSTSC